MPVRRTPTDSGPTVDEPDAIVAILTHLGFPTEPPPIANAPDPAL
jgi:hypothetical protein